MNRPITLDQEDAKSILRCLTLLAKCPPTVRQVIGAGDRAIYAAGLNPWCMNEGRADGTETCTPWNLSLLITELTEKLDQIEP